MESRGWTKRIWDHSWLPKSSMSRVMSPKLDVGLNWVCDLFYPGTKNLECGGAAKLFLLVGS